MKNRRITPPKREVLRRFGARRRVGGKEIIDKEVKPFVRDGSQQREGLVQWLALKMNQMSVTQIEMAKRTGISTRTIKSWFAGDFEKRKSPSLQNFIVCVEALGYNLNPLNKSIISNDDVCILPEGEFKKDVIQMYLEQEARARAMKISEYIDRENSAFLRANPNLHFSHKWEAEDVERALADAEWFASPNAGTVGTDRARPHRMRADDQRRRPSAVEEGGQLNKLEATVRFERFRTQLEGVSRPSRRSNDGLKPLDPVLLFRMLVLGELHGLSSARTERRVADRLSWRRFCGLGPCDAVPDAHYLSEFRAALVKECVFDELFEQLERAITEAGLLPIADEFFDVMLVPLSGDSETEI